jgi:hypothetical protein
MINLWIIVGCLFFMVMALAFNVIKLENKINKIATLLLLLQERNITPKGK